MGLGIREALQFSNMKQKFSILYKVKPYPQSPFKSWNVAFVLFLPLPPLNEVCVVLSGKWDVTFAQGGVHCPGQDVGLWAEADLHPAGKGDTQGAVWTHPIGALGIFCRQKSKGGRRERKGSAGSTGETSLALGGRFGKRWAGGALWTWLPSGLDNNLTGRRALCPFGSCYFHSWGSLFFG